MIPPSQRSLALNYEDLKNRFLSGIPDNFNIEEIKTNFRNISNILSRRRLGRIRDLSELLWRCEENLLILPETGEINLFQEIVSLVRDLNMHQVSPSTWEEVRMLYPAWSPAPATVGCLTPVPPQVVTKLIVRLTAAGTGRDWDHFSRALGTGLDREDDIKLKEGDLCRLERKYGDTEDKMRDLSFTDIALRKTSVPILSQLPQHALGPQLHIDSFVPSELTVESGKGECQQGQIQLRLSPC